MTDIVVLMSTYNGESFVKEQLDSILLQKNVGVRVVVRDDGSSDRTEEIVRSIDDDRITFIRGKNLGCSRSFFELLRYAEANYPDINYFAFADQDDYWLDDKLETACQYLRNQPDEVPCLYISNLYVTDEYLQEPTLLYPTEISLDKMHSLVENHATGCTMVFNREVVHRILKTNTDRYRIHDIPIFRLCLFSGNVHFDMKPHIYYRQHRQNVIGANYYARQRINSKLKSLSKFTKQHIKENDALICLEELKPYLSQEDIALFETVAFYRSNLKYRLTLLFSKRCRLRRPVDNFWFKVRVVLGCI